MVLEPKAGWSNHLWSLGANVVSLLSDNTKETYTDLDWRSGWGPCGTRVHMTLGISTCTNTVYYPHTLMLRVCCSAACFITFTSNHIQLHFPLSFCSSITHLSLRPSFPQADSVQPTGVRFSPGFLLPPLFSFLYTIVVPSMVLVNELLGGHSPRVNLLLFSFGLFPISFCCFLFPSPSLFFLFVPFPPVYGPPSAFRL